MLVHGAVKGQSFVYPGIHQTREDADYMKLEVFKGEQPWENAFDSLKENTDLSFEVKAFTHVMHGPYGKPNIGGDDLSKGSENIEVSDNLIHYNNSFGIESYSTINIKSEDNNLIGNSKPEQQKISNEKYIIMQ